MNSSIHATFAIHAPLATFPRSSSPAARRRSRTGLALASAAVLLLTTLAACGGGSDGTPAACADGALEPPQLETLQWKRASAVEADLSQALELDRAELCRELGLFDCVELHRVSLGASNPFGSALYRPVEQPLATTTTALDRVALAACGKRADLDAQGSPVVFGQFSLAGSAPAPDSAGATALINDLYRRFHRRDATPDEIALAGELAVDAQGQPVSGRDFAALTCFAVATTSEFLLF